MAATQVGAPTAEPKTRAPVPGYPYRWGWTACSHDGEPGVVV
jgi:hypothetical protein